LCTCCRIDRAEAAAVQPDVGARRELHRRAREVPQSGPRQLHAIEYIDELHTYVQIHAFLKPEVAAEVGVFPRLAKAPEGTNRALVGRELAVGNVRPCRRIQYLGLGRVKTVAVDVEWIGVADAIVVGPIHRPGIHARDQLCGNHSRVTAPVLRGARPR
jgi:hypothetical protein